MKRESHLFACHKYLEEAGSQILCRLAKADFRDVSEVEIISSQIVDYVTTLGNHAQWEEEYIFKKIFTQDEIGVFFEEHAHFENKTKKITEEAKSILNLDVEDRLYNGKQLYLNFRHFYASNLLHFYNEETTFLSLLQEKATDDEIRSIDKPIYENMSSNDIVEMLERLLPPTNISDKKNILEDLRNFNPHFENVIPQIRKILTQKEAQDIFTGSKT